MQLICKNHKLPKDKRKMAAINATQNGNGKVNELIEIQSPEELEMVPQPEDKPTKKAAKKRRGKNSCDVEVLMDAGANHCKAIVRFGEVEQMVHFPSQARIVQGNISPDNAGNFTHDGTNYASGRSGDDYMGEWLEAREGNKIDYIDCWLMAVLTHAKKVMSEAGKNKNRNGVTKLHCHIRLLTLSKEKKAEILETLQEIGSFEFNNLQYEVLMDALEVHPEGYGSAMAAWKADPTAERVNILDMGGGTLSFTSYSTEFGELNEAERTIADCGGVNAIVGALQLGMSSRDNAGIQLYPKFIERALRTSKTKQVLYDMGDDFQNIYEAFESAMCDWLQINPQVQHLLKFVRFALINNQKVFLTGGGFSSVVIQEFILNHLIRSGKAKGKAKRKKNDSIAIDRELIAPLDNGHILNITGLKELPSLIPSK